MYFKTYLNQQKLKATGKKKSSLNTCFWFAQVSLTIKEKVVMHLLCKHYDILGYLFSKQASAYGI